MMDGSTGKGHLTASLSSSISDTRSKEVLPVAILVNYFMNG